MTGRGCTGKVAYETRADAERARKGLGNKQAAGHKKRLRKKIAAGLNVYACGCCGRFHLGRPPVKDGPRRPSHGPNSLKALAARAYALIEGREV